MNRLFVTASAAFAVTAATAAWSAAPVFGSWGYDATSMDRSVRPGDDFFAFVNGNWDKRTQIAPDRKIGRAHV